MGPLRTAGVSLLATRASIFRHSDPIGQERTRNQDTNTAGHAWNLGFPCPHLSAGDSSSKYRHSALDETVRSLRSEEDPFIFCFSLCLRDSVVQRFFLFAQPGIRSSNVLSATLTSTGSVPSSSPSISVWISFGSRDSRGVQRNQVVQASSTAFTFQLHPVITLVKKFRKWRILSVRNS